MREILERVTKETLGESFGAKKMESSRHMPPSGKVLQIEYWVCLLCSIADTCFGLKVCNVGRVSDDYIEE